MIWLPQDGVHLLKQSGSAFASSKHCATNISAPRLQGWSLSMVTQYDVDLVHNIEDLIGVTLDAHEMDEAAVLKGITRVFKAKRAASMRIADEKGFEGVTASGQANKRARRQ